MGKTIRKKIIRNSKNKNILSMNRKRNKKTNKKTMKKSLRYKGGNESEFKSIMLSVLKDDYIPFLPTSISVNDKNIRENYLSSVCAFDLLSLIGNSDKYSNSKTITGIIKEIDTEDNNDLMKLLGNLTKVPLTNKVMSKFIINCSILRNNQNLKELREFILECEDYISLKYTNWYKVCLGLISLDDNFEGMILTEIKDRKIFIDTDKLKYGLNILYKDDSIKNMFKSRIIECGHKPQGFFDKLSGNISWDSYNKCFKCSNNKCTVYLDENYKSFLYKKHNIKSIDKIKILIYVDLRLRLFSKYISLECLRIIKKKYSKVKSILNKIYKLDQKRNRLNNNELKQSVMNSIIGGSNEIENSVEVPNTQQSGYGSEDTLKIPQAQSGSESGDYTSTEVPVDIDIPPGPVFEEPKLQDDNVTSPGPVFEEPKLQDDNVTPPGPVFEEPKLPDDGVPSNPEVTGENTVVFENVNKEESSGENIEEQLPTSSINTDTEIQSTQEGTIQNDSQSIPTQEGNTQSDTNQVDPTQTEDSIFDTAKGALNNIFSGENESVEQKQVGQIDFTEGTPEQGSPEQASPEQGSPEQASPEQGSPEQGSPEQGSPEQGVSEERSPEKVNLEQKSTTQNTSNQTENSDDKNIDTSATIQSLNAPIRSDNIKSSDIIYFTFKDTKVSEDINELNSIRNSIATEVKDTLDTLIKPSNNKTINVVRIRFGPSTTSIEVYLNITDEEKMSKDTIKAMIVDFIVRDTIKQNLDISNLGILDEVYFDRISEYKEINSKPANYKRLLFEIPGIYPVMEDDRITFEENVIKTIKDILNDPELETERIHLERVSRVKNDNKRVVVQFLIMDGYESSVKSNVLIQNFKINYSKDKSDYFNIYGVKNVVFGEPSIKLNDNTYNYDETLRNQMKSIEGIDTDTLNELTKGYEEKYHPKIYYGCEMTIRDIKDNMITSETPFNNECELVVNNYLNGV